MGGITTVAQSVYTSIELKLSDRTRGPRRLCTEISHSQCLNLATFLWLRALQSGTISPMPPSHGQGFL